LSPFKPLAVAAAITTVAFAIVLPAYASPDTGAPHQGSAVTASNPKTKTYKIKVRKHGKTHGPKIAYPEALQAGGCLPPIVGFGREDLCIAFPVTVEVLQLEDGTPDGNEETHSFLVQTQVGLSAKSTSFNIDVAVVGLSTSGDDPGLDPSLTIASQCDRPCTDTSPQLLAVGTPQVAAGGASNEATTPANHVVWPKPAISLYAEYGGDQSNTVSWPIVPVIRCDHMYPTAWRKPGCVFAAFIPTVDMSGLKVIAKNIRAVQKRGGHYGKPGGSHPLHRNSSQQETNNNRHLVCPKHLKRPPGDQCDEYPFASTWEGGTKLPPADRYRGWVPARENSLQGAILKRFYADNRVLRGSPGDAFYVNAS
jgi:hypothetical protein